jgi:predicted XRE-type DNA-binding protein
MRKDNRYGDTADTLAKLHQFVIAVMAIQDHSQVQVGELTETTQSQISRFLKGKGQGVELALRMLDYCEKYDPSGRAYKIVQMMNQ